MADSRENFMMLAVGKQGVGKSYQTELQANMYCQHDHKLGRLAKPVLYFDTNGEYGHMRTIKYDVSDKNDNGIYISQFKIPQIRRVSNMKPNGEPMTMDEKKKTFLDICRSFRNGLVIFEDINTYLVQTSTEEVTSTLVNLRHRGLDVIIHLQSLSAVTPRMFQNTRYIRFHHQMDELKRIKYKTSNYEMMLLAKTIVDQQCMAGSERFFVYADGDRRKIIGCSQDQYISGLREYSEEHKKDVSSMLRKNAFLYL